MPSQKQIREEITAKIIEALEKGVKPWRRPWTVSPNSGRPMNFVSHRLYRPFTKTVENDKGDQEEHDYMLMRTFVVFNADQVEGRIAEKLQVKDEPASGIVLPNYGPAEELIAATQADIRHGGDRAYYRRPEPEGSWPSHNDGDFIMLPPKHRFNPVNAYYEVAIHELSHWSEIRTGWDHGKQGYAMGELAAEIAASFLSTELGIPQGEDLSNHVSYLASWLKEMKSDPAYIFRASTQASRVADYLLSFVRKEEPVVAS